MTRGGGVYGYELHKRLASHGEGVQLSYLYKTLKEMCEEGLLEGRLQPGEHGPQRRQYRLTGRGIKELGRIFGEATELIHDYYEEYVANLPPEFFSERFHTMMGQVCDGRESAAMVISEPLTHLHREILEGLAQRAGGLRTYLIKPRHVTAQVDLPNLTILEGRFDDIPLKDKGLDALLVVDIQDATNIGRCCREFRRVLRAGGVLFGCAPFMGLGGARDPLEVGEFMKKTKYNWSHRPYLDRESIRRTLDETFDYVDVASMSFLTAFVSGLKPIRT